MAARLRGRASIKERAKNPLARSAGHGDPLGRKIEAHLIAWRPALGSVDDIDNFDRIRSFQYTIDHDEWQRRQGQVSGPLHPPAPSLIRVGSERAGAIVNRLSHALCSVWVVCPDVIENLLEVFSRSG